MPGILVVSVARSSSAKMGLGFFLLMAKGLRDWEAGCGQDGGLPGFDSEGRWELFL